MRKLILCLVLICILLCSGCHGKVEHPAFEIPSEFDSGKQYEIVFWAKNENNPTQRAIYEEAVAGFEKLYPNIKVTLKDYVDYNTIREDVRTNLVTDTTPNVCITYPDHVAEYMQGENVIVPLDELMADTRYGFSGSEVRFDTPSKEEIIQKFLNECAIDGHFYALPFMRSTEACYVNKTYVEKLGYTLPDVLTWDFVFEVAAAAMEKGEDGLYKVNGKDKMLPIIYKSEDNMMIQMLKQLDAPYSTDDGKIEIFNDTTKEILLTVMRNSKAKIFDTFTRASYPANALNKGECIFAIDSTAGSTWMGCDAPLLEPGVKEKTVRFEIAVRPVPQFDTDNIQMISQGPSVCIFNKDDSGEVLASWLFVQYLLTDEVQLAYSSTEGYIPVTSKAYESAEYQEYLNNGGTDNDMHYKVKIDAKKLMHNNIDNTFVTPVFSGSASLRNAAGELIVKARDYGRRKGDNVDAAYFEELFSDIYTIYHLDQIEAVNTSESGVGVKSNFGKLPTMAVVLIVLLAAAWIFIAAMLLYSFNKKRKK
ncbi:MAG: extracellular solute-binding protein [Clostridia bacterium]|nr:extracellular solute-binding protein [Clostridia bacterium]